MKITLFKIKSAPTFIIYFTSQRSPHIHSAGYKFSNQLYGKLKKVSAYKNTVTSLKNCFSSATSIFSFYHEAHKHRAVSAASKLERAFPQVYLSEHPTEKDYKRKAPFIVGQLPGLLLHWPNLFLGRSILKIRYLIH